MEEGMIFAIVIACIIQVVVLVVFFVMAKNISTIKKHITNNLTVIKYTHMADEEIYIGNKEKAKEYLLRAKYICEVVYDGYGYIYIDGEKFDRIEFIADIDKKLAEL